MKSKFEKQVVATTASLVLREGQWLTEGLHHATREFVKASDDEYCQAELWSWRRLAFRLFPSEIEAFSSANRDLSRLAVATGASRKKLSRKIVNDHEWRRLALNQRFNVALDTTLDIYDLERTNEDKVTLSDLLARLRSARRQMAHPKSLPDLFPEERDCEVLRRAMLGVLEVQRRIALAAVPANERSALEVVTELPAERPLRQIALRKHESGWDTDFYGEVEASRSKADHLVHCTLLELGKDSCWAIERAMELDDSLKETGQPSGYSMGARVLGATFFGEIEGTCAILSRAVLYAHHRHEVQLTPDEEEWLGCVAGTMEVKDARSSTRGSLDLETQIKRSLMLYERASSRSASVAFSGQGWESVAQAIALRDQLYHPQHTRGLLLSLDDTLTLVNAMDWFRGARDQLTLTSAVCSE